MYSSYCLPLTSPAGSDYTDTTMTLTFRNGSTTSQSIPVTIGIVDDPTVEESESFSLTLTTTDSVMLDPASATVNIQVDSNDGKLVCRLAQ